MNKKITNFEYNNYENISPDKLYCGNQIPYDLGGVYANESYNHSILYDKIKKSWFYMFKYNFEEISYNENSIN